MPEALRSAGLGPEDLVALGIANQRETTVVWDRRTGVPISRAITWQDTRTDGIVARLADDGHAPLIAAVCGLAPATYFAGPRLRWMLDHVPGAREGADAGDLLFGTMESWLIWNLTGGPDGGRHVTDVTNASRTMLMDLRTLEWSDALLAVLDVPRRMLPEIRSNAEVYGTCTSVLPGVPVAGALGDQQAALFGQTCFDPGEAKCTYGTGAFLLMNTGARIAESTHGLIPTVGYLLEPMATGGEPVYALEGADRDDGLARAVVPRLARHDRHRSADRDAGRDRRGQRRLLHRPRVLRAVLAALAPRRPRRDRRADVVHHPGPPRPRGPGGHRVADARGRRRHERSTPACPSPASRSTAA